LILKKASKKWLLFIGAVALYAALLAWMRWCPPVSGVAVDAETGKPIENAEIVRIGEGPYIISAETHVYFQGSEALAKTDAQGRFSLSPTVSDNLGPACFLPLGWVNSIALNVYAAYHIPSEVHEDVWRGIGRQPRYKATSGGWEEARSERAVFKRKHRWFRGYQYHIELASAKTEQDWIAKCEETILLYDKFVSHEFAEQWKFKDLTGFWMRFP